MSVHQKIRDGRAKLGMTEKEFGDRVGVSRGAVQQWEKGTTAPTRKNQPAVAALLGISVAELMSQDATATPSGLIAHGSVGQVKASGTPSPIPLTDNPDYPAVRRVSVKAQAGITGYAIEDVEDMAPIVFRADWYKSKGYRPDRMMALRVAGESMEPGLHAWPV